VGIEKKMIYGRDARKAVLSGILKCGRAVASTFGPRGRQSVVYKGSSPYMTRDGMKTVQAISFRDELENIGACLMKEVCTRANFSNGDGSSTVVIIAAALCKKAEDLLDGGMDINVLVKGFREAAHDVMGSIDSKKFPVKGDDDLRRVALISAHGDDEVADLVVKAFTGIGENGVVAIADSLSRKGKSDVIFSTGCDFERGFLSSQSVNTKSDTCDVLDPLVLLISKPVEAFEDVIPFLQYAQSNERPVVMIAPDFDDSVVAGFNGNLSKKALSGAMILSPGVSKQDVKERMRDLNVLLGGRILHEDVETDQFDMTSDFGGCGQMIVHANKTEVIDPKTDRKKFEDHAAELKAKIEKDDVDEAYTEFEIEKIKSRIAHMEGGVATIKVGGLTTMEVEEKKDRYEDAVNAVRAVLKEGMVLGGGTCLLKIALELEKLRSDPAYCGFIDAVKEPFRVLVRSTGRSVESVMLEILGDPGSQKGFDAREMRTCDLYEAGIMDSLKVIKNDVMYASSVAETYATLDVAIVSDLGSVSIKPVDPAFQEFFGEGM